MTIQERREKEIEVMREKILAAAEAIAADEGFEQVSIRKIAKKIQYSPATIYHYFKDKDSIIQILMQRGYGKIMAAVADPSIATLPPDQRLMAMSRNYIQAALSMPEEFKNAQLNTSEEALQFTSSLFKGALKVKPALGALANCIKALPGNDSVDEDLLELTAQMVAASTFGLIIKLTVEKQIDAEQRQRLINFFIEDTVMKISAITPRED